MKRLSTLTALAISLTLLSCDQKDTPGDNGNQSDASQTDGTKQEKIANEIMDSMQDFATAISSITDTKSANAAAIKINKIGDNFASYAEELKPLDPPTGELRESINRKMEAREAEMKKVMSEKFMKTIQTLNPEAQKIMQDSFQKFFKKMDQAGKEFERHFKTEE